jgi:hypothetical protein
MAMHAGALICLDLHLTILFLCLELFMVNDLISDAGLQLHLSNFIFTISFSVIPCHRFARVCIWIELLIYPAKQYEMITV